MSSSYILESIAIEFGEKYNYKLIKFSGKGASKETYCISDSKNNKYALKLILSENFNPRRTKREINALKKCETPLIGKLFDFGTFISSTNDKYYFSLEEYLDGGTLTEKIKNEILPPKIVRSYSITLVKAITYLKNKNLVHRDIKPDNIMFRSSSNDPVLVDLGIVRDLSTSSLTLTWLPRGPGTPYFSSPEQLNNEKHLIKWRSDQFSLAIVLSICLTGLHPFQEEEMNRWEVVEAIAQRKTCTEEFKNKVLTLGFDGILKMLAPWPVQRFNSPETLLKYFEGVQI